MLAIYKDDHKNKVADSISSIKIYLIFLHFDFVPLSQFATSNLRYMYFIPYKAVVFKVVLFMPKEYKTSKLEINPIQETEKPVYS